MKQSFKPQLVLLFSIIGVMLFYLLVFGSKNVGLGISIALAAFFSLGNDLSYKPFLSFFKVLGLLLILALVAFLNTPLTVFACILTFFVVFGTTFTSYHLFGSDVYLPYLMCYFMMMCVPVTTEDLPMRVLSLVFGVVFIVGLNVLVNNKKDYKLSKLNIENLVNEVNNAIDLKLAGENVSNESFKTANGFYSGLLNRFEYKYFPNHNQQAAINFIKAFQYIGYGISNYDLSSTELNYIKDVLSKIREIDADDIFSGIRTDSEEMSVILLNLEIIAKEINNDLSDDSIIPDKKEVREIIRPIIKRHFSFRSAKFTFAFKMAVMMFIWEVLTLIFNLPYTKWLYFVTIPVMVPYIDDLAYTAKSRIKGTFIGVFVFAVIILLLPFIPIDSRIVIIIVMMACMVIMVFYLNDKVILNSVTTVMSVIAALMYIEPPQAIELKLLWVIVGVGVVSLFNFKFLPYSVEKETKNNLKCSFKLNERSIGLIKEKCRSGYSKDKTTLLVVSNIVRENIEVTDENSKLYELQSKITDICNFVVTFLDFSNVSDELKYNLIEIIDYNGTANDNLNNKDKVIAYSTEYVMKLFEKERRLI